MFYLLFSVAFAVVALFYVLNGMRKGKKYIWSYSLARTIVAIVSAVASAFLSAGLTFFFVKMGFTAIANTGNSENLAGLMNTLPVTLDALCALVSMIVAPMLFYVIFGVLRHVLDLVAKIIIRSIAKAGAKKKIASPAEEGDVPSEEMAENAAEVAEEPSQEAKKEKRKKRKDDGYFRIRGKKNPWGRLCGAICGLVLFLATMIPAVGMLGILNDMTAWGTAGAAHPLVQNVATFIDAGANNVGAKTVRVLGGDALYSIMTTYSVGDEKATLAKETNLLGVMGHAISDTSNKELPRKQAAETVRQIDEAFSETTLIPSVVPEFLNASKASWDRGEEYYGIKMPSFGKMDGFVHPILNVLGNSTRATVRDDVATLVDSIAYMVEKDAMDDVKEDPMSIFKKQDVTATVMYRLLLNDHLAPLVGDVSEYGLQLFGEAMGASMSNVDFVSAQIQNPETESKKLAEALAEMAAMTETINAGGFRDTDSIASIGPLMDCFAATETIGSENTKIIVTNILSSSRILSITNLTEEEAIDFANDINERAESLGYEIMMKEFADMMKMIEELTR